MKPLVQAEGMYVRIMHLWPFVGFALFHLVVPEHLIDGFCDKLSGGGLIIIHILRLGKPRRLCTWSYSKSMHGCKRNRDIDGILLLGRQIASG